MKFIKIVPALIFTFAFAASARAQENTAASDSVPNNTVLFKYPFNTEDVNRVIYSAAKDGAAKIKTAAKKNAARPPSVEMNGADIVNKLKKSTFIIWVKKKYYTQYEPQELQSIGFTGFGTGFLIKVSTPENPSGELMIMTNAHVAYNNLSEYEITRADTRDKAKGVPFVLGYDTLGDDLALIKVADKKFFDGMVPLKLADNPSRIGEKIHVLNFEDQNTDYTYKSGECSSYDNFYMRVSAIINKGASGSAVVNNNSEVTGVINAKANPTEDEPIKVIQMAIPLKTVKRFLRQVALGQQPLPPALGTTSFVRVDPSAAGEYFNLSGVRAENICDNSVLSDAGINNRCLIMAIDGKSLKPPYYLEDDINRSITGYIYNKIPGDTIKLGFYNPADSTVRTASLPLKNLADKEKLYQAGEIPGYKKIGGLTIVELSSVKDAQTVTPYLQITKIDPDTEIRADYVIGQNILRVNDAPVKTIKDLEEAVKKNSVHCKIDVDNNNYTIYVNANK